MVFPVLTTLVAAGSKQHLEVMFTVFPALKLSTEFKQFVQSYLKHALVHSHNIIVTTSGFLMKK